MTEHDDFDELVKAADATMIVVTAAYRGERAGCLVGFHCQCSIEPIRYAVWLSKANHTCRIALQATHLGIHFLRQTDLGLAQLFGENTGEEMDKFARVTSIEGAGGAPLLTDCANRMVVRRITSMDDGGDHVCFITQAEHVNRGAEIAAPMHLSDVSEMRPGHAAEERAAQP